MKFLKVLRNFLLFAGMIVLGLLAAKQMMDKQKPVEHEETSMPAKIVQIMDVMMQPYTPGVVAWGYVEPAMVFEGKAQVSGKISFVHADLKAGGSIPKGTVVVEIDPEDYQTSLRQSKADLSASRSQLDQLTQEEKNTRNALELAMQNLRAAQQNMKNVQRKKAPIAKNTQLIQQNINLLRQNLNITQKNLDLAKRNLILAKKEAYRLNDLAKRRLIAQNQAESQQQKVISAEQQVLQLEQSLVQQRQSIVQQEQQLTQQDQSDASQDQNVLQQQQQIIQNQQSVTDLNGQLATYASRRANVIAQMKRIEQQVKGQQTTLGRTKITMPFDARITQGDLDKGEFVSTGGVLFEAINASSLEIRAELPLDTLNILMAVPEQGAANNIGQVLNDLPLQAEVRRADADQDIVWEARVSRFSESIDSVRRTVGIVIAVDNPYSSSASAAGTYPVLMKGMYVQATIMAPEQQALVIPRTAIHQGRAYVMNAGDQLEIRPVKTRWQDSQQVLVVDGLDAGERLIVNDLIPVIPGMPLKVKEAP
uniref:Efflux RND transporter periplasmic adaptor subunit n=1 Tax=uncultured Thiotrichaceae bacterium TaxID=298394 RepID=A0A6S6RYR6_9GAMM|nr:MAG: Efflux RND transporter periplasmic adaptor subunit [uncultured Thiotrichaceae bacterium]